MNWEGRVALASACVGHPSMRSVREAGTGGLSVVDLKPRVEDGRWEPWASSVPTKEMEPHQAKNARGGDRGGGGREGGRDAERGRDREMERRRKKEDKVRSSFA
jgi:hypothetical protein